MSVTERAPRRQNSRVAQVYPLLLEGKPGYVIAQETGLQGTQLTEAIRGNYRLGYVNPPSLAERQQQHRENTSFAKGGVYLDIQPYLDLDLTARQTQLAIRVSKGKEYSLSQVSSAYSREMHRHGFVRPTDELTIEAQRDKRRTRDELLQIIFLRQLARAYILENGWNKPKTLQGWKVVGEQPDEKEMEILAPVFQEGINVENNLDKWYLLELYKAQRLWQQTGDRRLLDHFGSVYEDIDPTIHERLQSQVRDILNATAITY